MGLFNVLFFLVLCNQQSVGLMVLMSIRIEICLGLVELMKVKLEQYDP